MIIPIGHDKGVSRFPYVTAAIMAICVVVQIYATFKLPSDAELRDLAREREAVFRQAWGEYGGAYVREKAPDLYRGRPRYPSKAMEQTHRRRALRRQFVTDFKDGKIVAENHHLLRWLHQVEDKRHALYSFYDHGYTPGGSPLTLVTHAFMHGGWLHLIGNMIFLWLCGCNMEDRWGHLLWSLLYLAGAAVSALAFGLARGWESGTPLVGASGAVAAAMGAFLVVHYNATIRFFYVIWYMTLHSGTFQMKAYWALPLWFIEQLLGSLVEGPLVPVAYSAHVGGFLFGIGAALLMKLSGSDRRLVQAEADKRTVFTQSPLHLDAIAAVERGDHEQARDKLQQLLQHDPHHVDGAIELFRLAVKEGDGDAAVSSGTHAVQAARRAGDQMTARKVHLELQQAFPERVLEPRALFFVGESFARDDAKTAFSVFEQLIKRFPDDPLVPRAWLNAAGLYAGPLGESQRARKMYAQMVQRYRDSPFAVRAREELARLDAAPAQPSAQPGAADG